MSLIMLLLSPLITIELFIKPLLTSTTVELSIVLSLYTGLLH